MCVARYHAGKAFIIDVSQSVEHDHPNALTFLRKDCSNITGGLGLSLRWLSGGSQGKSILLVLQENLKQMGRAPF